MIYMLYNLIKVLLLQLFSLIDIIFNFYFFMNNIQQNIT